MIQFFLSKVTVSVIALTLIAMAIGYFVVFDKSAYDVEASQLANEVASRIDEIAAQNMVEKIYFMYNGSMGIHLPAKIGNEYYTLQISTRIVSVRMHNYGYAAYLHSTVYTFNPKLLDGKKVTTEMLHEYQLKYNMVISHTDNFCVEQKYMLVDGLWQYVTFVYLLDE
jgi:hypothetical protein